MSETVITGYNTLIKVGASGSQKTFAGVTSDDLDLSAETKESITKADAGTKRVSVTRIPATLTVSGVCSTDSETSVLSRSAIIALVGTTVSVTYALDTTNSLTGTGLVTNYKETTPADPESDPTYSLTILCANGLTSA